MKYVNPPETTPTVYPSRLSVRTNVRAPGVSRIRFRARSSASISRPSRRATRARQRVGEVEPAGHGQLRDLSHLGVAARLLCEKLDHLVLDQGGVDVEHDESLGATFQAGGLERDVEAVGSGCLGEHTLEFGPVSTSDQELVGVARGIGRVERCVRCWRPQLPSQPAIAPSSAGDNSVCKPCPSTVTASRPPTVPVGGGIGSNATDRPRSMSEVGEHLLDASRPVGRSVDRHGKGQVTSYQHLFGVLHRHPCEVQQRHEVRGDTRVDPVR